MFPLPETDKFAASDGISLRDLFAGFALAGIAGEAMKNEEPIPPDAVAHVAYTMADAMLLRREK